MSDKPDFDALRKRRDEAVIEIVRAFAKERGLDPDKLTFSMCPPGCLCACPDGPCEHEFAGWRDFEDGSGGETVCQKCGMGCMSHDMRVAP